MLKVGTESVNDSLTSEMELSQELGTVVIEHSEFVLIINFQY